jgi:hypothetical protein
MIHDAIDASFRFSAAIFFRRGVFRGVSSLLPKYIFFSRKMFIFCFWGWTRWSSFFPGRVCFFCRWRCFSRWFSRDYLSTIFSWLSRRLFQGCLDDYFKVVSFFFFGFLVSIDRVIFQFTIFRVEVIGFSGSAWVRDFLRAGKKIVLVFFRWGFYKFCESRFFFISIFLFVCVGRCQGTSCWWLPGTGEIFWALNCSLWTMWSHRTGGPAAR